LRRRTDDLVENLSMDAPLVPYATIADDRHLARSLPMMERAVLLTAQ